MLIYIPLMSPQQQVIQSLPAHLRPFVAYQDYALYTPRDHAVWRFLLHQLTLNLSKSAHPTYIQGLKKTGLSLEEIPRIETINDHLSEFGWRAVVVDGFLHPAIFMEFQAHRILAIAVNIRSYEHMLYTPAPDIIHESAGHAPFIVDIEYSQFLQRLGELGMLAISTDQDLQVYEAIRDLSIIKEASNSTDAQIESVEERVSTAYARNQTPSESAFLARFYWWTVEYGLVGQVNDYRIYGAGLLSSLGESVNCLDDNKVKKIPLSLDALKFPYDTTAEQAQLFVTRSWNHQSQVLEKFAQQMCCNRGDSRAIEEAIESGTVNTLVLNSGLQISGQLVNLVKDDADNPVYIQTAGTTQLAFNNMQLPKHGIQRHANGFGTPVGKIISMQQCLSSYTLVELKRQNIEIGQSIQLQFESGIELVGLLTDIVQVEQKNLVFTFVDCTVKDSYGKIMFDPKWGQFDMAIGTSIDAVFGGSADKDTFPIYAPSTMHTPQHQATDQHTDILFDLYKRVRKTRENSTSVSNVQLLTDEIFAVENVDWLLLFELLELSIIVKTSIETTNDLVDRLLKIKAVEKNDVQTLINCGLDRLGY